MLTRVLIICSLLIFSGCAAVTITESGTGDFQYRPHYQETKHFFLWGVVGEHHINTREICGDRVVAQMQSKFMAKDVLYAALTLGIYFPRTARVWCQREGEA